MEEEFFRCKTLGGSGDCFEKGIRRGGEKMNMWN